MSNQYITCFKLKQPRSYKYMRVSSCGDSSTPKNNSNNNNTTSSILKEQCHKSKLSHQISATENGASCRNSKKSSPDNRNGGSSKSYRHSPAYLLMRFWFFRSSMAYLLKKMTTACIAPGHYSGSSEIEEISCVDPYFSIPVVPATTIMPATSCSAMAMH